MGELGIKHGIGLACSCLLGGNYTSVLSWHCCSLVVLIGTGFRGFFFLSLLFFLREIMVEEGSAGTCRHRWGRGCSVSHLRV